MKFSDLLLIYTASFALYLFISIPLNADDSIPVFQYDNQHTGRTEHIGPSDAQLKWKYHTQGSIQSSPVIAADGTLYVTSTDGYLYALSPEGLLKWSYAAEESIFGSPALMQDGSVLFGDLNGNYYAINPDGSEKWVHKFSGGSDRRIICGPVVDSNGQSYVGAWNDSFIAVTPEGTQRWKAMVSGAISSSPALDEQENVYAASLDRNDLAFYKFRPSSNNPVWKFTEPLGVGQNRILSSPAVDVSRGAAYVGACRHADGFIVAVNTSNGNRFWRRILPKGVLSTPAIGLDGTIYTGCLDGKLYALRPENGEILWSFDVEGDYILGTPSIDGHGIIYIGDSDGSLYAVAPGGEEIWRYQANANVHSSPVIAADGTLYFTSYDSTLYALQQPTAVRDWLMMRR